MRIVKHYDDRRREIVEMAKALFLQHGAEHTPVSRLIKEIGIAHGLFYYYFKSKEEVVDAVIASMLDDIAGVLADKLDAAGADLHCCLEALVGVIFELYGGPMVHSELSKRFVSRYHDQIVDVMCELSGPAVDRCAGQEPRSIQRARQVVQMVLSGSLYLIGRAEITRDGLMDLIALMLKDIL